MTPTPTITYIIFLIFFGTAILSTIALFTRQSLLVAYIALGTILGPWGLKLLSNGTVIKQAGEIGIIFLLFLLGLHLQPQSLFHSMRKMSSIALFSSIIFFVIGFLPGYFFGYTQKKVSSLVSRLCFRAPSLALNYCPRPFCIINIQVNW